MTGFQTCNQKGFHITFSNGYKVSVQFGRGNYSSNYDWKGEDPENPNSVYMSHAPESRTAEVAAWHGDGNFITLPDGDIVGSHWSPEQVLYLQNKIASLQGDEMPDFSDWEIGADHDRQ